MATTARSLREKHVADNRRRLRRAAMDLFAERGLAATTVDAIAERADVSPRTFFRYFATKEAVLFESVEVRLQALASLVAERPADESPFEALVAALRRATDELVSDPDLRKVLRRLGPEAAGLRPQRAALAARFEPEILVALAPRAGVATDDLGLRAMVNAVGACTEVAVQAWIERGADDAFRPYLDRALEACADAFSSASGEGRPGTGG